MCGTDATGFPDRIISPTSAKSGEEVQTLQKVLETDGTSWHMEPCTLQEKKTSDDDPREILPEK